MRRVAEPYMYGSVGGPHAALPATPHAAWPSLTVERAVSRAEVENGDRLQPV
jgi:hypothetical protein